MKCMIRKGDNMGLRMKCVQKRYDCFACDSGGKCRALSDTRFNYKCPFYRSARDMTDEEIKETFNHR